MVLGACLSVRRTQTEVLYRILTLKGKKLKAVADAVLRYHVTIRSEI